MYKNFCEEPLGKRPLVKLSWSLEDNIKMGFRKWIRWLGMDRTGSGSCLIVGF
jgi:hypothetical protein